MKKLSVLMAYFNCPRSFLRLPKADNDILRIHIIANSNSRLDQDIKHE